ncbi:MAG: hypothetical protein HY748_09240 [Elusimicrobia bacterium]|nr:hypothetical protein [Elusimicrobiota bacterium]
MASFIAGLIDRIDNAAALAHLLWTKQASGFKDLSMGAAVGAVPLFVENALLVSLVAFIAMRYFIVERQKAQTALEEEHRKLLKEPEQLVGAGPIISSRLQRWCMVTPYRRDPLPQ